MKFWILLSTPFVCACATAGAAVIPMSAFNALVNISSPAVSPDGTRIAFIATTADLNADKHLRRLEVISSAGGSARALAPPSDDLSAPAWTPSGDAIAYIGRGKDKQDQIFLVDARGGPARQVTRAPNGVQQFAWSPDGKRFAFVTPDDPPNAAAAKRGDNLFTIRDDGYLIDGPARPSHVWLIAANGGPATRLTSGSWSVLEAAPPFVGAASAPSWSHDGRFIAFTRQADADDSDTDRTTVAIVDVRSGLVHALTKHPGYEYQPEFSPVGDSVQYIYPHGPGPVSVMNVYVGDRDVSAPFDRDVQAAQWMPDGRSVVVMTSDHILSALWRIDTNGHVRRLPAGGRSVEDFDVGKTGAIAFVASSANAAPELYYLRAGANAPVKLTSLNAGFGRYQYGRTAELQWSAADGERSDGLVTYPPQYRPGRTYPLVVYIHGGPEAASLSSFGGGEIGRLRYGLSASDYIVFEPNYRGSDNLGNAHEHAIYRDPGTGPGRDVMAGIAALERTGAVDRARIAVVGHSYGGYMTSWLIGHEHLWRSAVVADGVVDWREEYDLSAAGNLAWTRDSLGGTPTDPSAAPLYRSGSPITYAGAMTTPTLILSGTADETVPISESFELYHALHDRHIEVHFIGLPGAHHSPSKPVQIDRYYAAILDWVTSHMPGRPKS